MRIIFEDMIWVAQSATCGNIQDAAVDLAELAIGWSKKLGLHAFSFLQQEVRSRVVLSIVSHCNTLIAIHNILGRTLSSFATCFHFCMVIYTYFVFVSFLGIWSLLSLLWLAFCNGTGRHVCQLKTSTWQCFWYTCTLLVLCVQWRNVIFDGGTEHSISRSCNINFPPSLILRLMTQTHTHTHTAGYEWMWLWCFTVCEKQKTARKQVK
jgi:hypothetical protein